MPTLAELSPREESRVSASNPVLGSLLSAAGSEAILGSSLSAADLSRVSATEPLAVKTDHLDEAKAFATKLVSSGKHPLSPHIITSVHKGHHPEVVPAQR